MAKIESQNEFKLYGHAWKKALFPFESLGISKKNIQLVRKRIPSRAVQWLQKLGGFGIESFLGKIDLFHYTDFVYPRLRGTPFVATIHDAAFLEEGYFTPASRTALKERSLWVIQNSRLIIVPSKFIAGELVLRLGAKPGRIAVVPLGADHVGTVHRTEAAKTTRPYFLTVGTIEPRKNHLRILQAFEILAKNGLPHRWIVVGRKGWLFEPFLEALSKSPVRNRVELHHETTETELATLYAGAELAVYASLYEGFGLPPLEAMRHGCAALTSSISSMPEVCGRAAYYIDPGSVESIAQGLQELLENRELRERLAKAGLQHASLFTWEESARRTLSVYDSALKQTEGRLSKLF